VADRRHAAFVERGLRRFVIDARGKEHVVQFAQIFARVPGYGASR
jgi:hypothetical protein